MKISVFHKTSLLFDNEIIPSPITFRNIPFQMAHYVISDFQQSVLPLSAQLTTKNDIVNNCVSFAWFNSPTREVCIQTSFKIITTPFNPEEFYVYPPQFLSLNFHYSRKRWPLLVPYLETNPFGKETKRFAKTVSDNSKNETLTFIKQLTKAINENFVFVPENGSPLSNPKETMKAQKGTVSEIAWLQAHMLRINGIATRFVSGYRYAETGKFNERHTWLQVYVPGPGWIGFDALTGNFTNYCYIPVYATPYVENLTCCAGGPTGSVTQQVKHKVEIKRVAD